MYIDYSTLEPFCQAISDHSVGLLLGLESAEKRYLAVVFQTLVHAFKQTFAIRALAQEGMTFFFPGIELALNLFNIAVHHQRIFVVIAQSVPQYFLSP